MIVPWTPPISQSPAILEYLDETARAQPTLAAVGCAWPRAGALDRGRLRADTHPLVVPWVRRYLTRTGGFDDAAWRAWQIQRGTGAFCHGDSVTIADIPLASIIAVMRMFKISVADIPTVDRIMTLCGTHPAFVNANPFKQAGAPTLCFGMPTNKTRAFSG